MTLALSIDLGQTDNLTTSSTQTRALITRKIGLITDFKRIVNQTFYLKNRPNNNLFSVKILDENNLIHTIENDYVLTLHFEKIK